MVGKMHFRFNAEAVRLLAEMMQQMLPGKRNKRQSMPRQQAVESQS